MAEATLKPGAQAPATPKAETPKVETKKLTLIAEMVALTLVELAKLGKTIVKMTEKIVQSRDEERKERKVHAKIVAELKRRHAKQVNAGDVPADYSFAKFFERETGGKCPGRTQSLAGLFNSLVLLDGPDGKPLISESIYDGAALDWLEKANAIVNAAIKQHGEAWKSCDEVKRAIAALSSPGDAAETLDAIRKEQKGTETTDGESAEQGVTVSLTPENAVEFLLKHLDDQLKLVGTKPENAREIFCSLAVLGNRLNDVGLAQDAIADAFAANYDEPTLKSWVAVETTVLPSGIIVLGTAPVETPAAAPVEKLDSLVPSESELATV